MKAIREFRNELGNDIFIEVSSGPEDVNVYADGPTSSVEHEWTRQEAIVLRDLLIEVLGS